MASDHGTAARSGRSARRVGRSAYAHGMTPVIRSVGVPKEVKTAEHRVAMTPDGVRELERHGIQVCVETGAGEGASITDADFVAAGADIVPTAADAWSQQMVVKVKEPKEEEFAFLRDDLTLFTYLHLAAYPEVAKALLAAGTTSLAYETVQLDDGALPLLAPMSEVAGRLAPQQGAHFLERHNGGPRRADGRRARRPPGEGRRASAPATSGGTRRGSPPAWRPRSFSSTRTSTACAGSTRSTAAAS